MEVSRWNRRLLSGLLLPCRLFHIGALDGAMGTGAPDRAEVDAQFGGQFARRG